MITVATKYAFTVFSEFYKIECFTLTFPDKLHLETKKSLRHCTFVEVRMSINTLEAEVDTCILNPCHMFNLVRQVCCLAFASGAHSTNVTTRTHTNTYMPLLMGPSDSGHLGQNYFNKNIKDNAPKSIPSSHRCAGEFSGDYLICDTATEWRVKEMHECTCLPLSQTLGDLGRSKQCSSPHWE